MAGSTQNQGDDMPPKKRRDPKGRPVPNDRRISLAPLDFEQALGGILRAGSHPAQADEPESDSKTPSPKKRRTVRKVKPSADG